MKRIQRKRTKGWRMPENTVYVGRPSKWGNPFRLTKDGVIECYVPHRRVPGHWIDWSLTGGFNMEDILELYERWLNRELLAYVHIPPDVEELRGKDLACWCKEGEPCHGDVLIEYLNKKHGEL